MKKGPEGTHESDNNVMRTGGVKIKGVSLSVLFEICFRNVFMCSE